MADRYLRASGNWNGAVWASTAGGVAGSAATPTAGDYVNIGGSTPFNAYTVTLTADANADTVDLIGSGGSSLILNGFKLTCQMSFELGGPQTLDMTNSVLEVGASSSLSTSDTFNISYSAPTLISSGSLLIINRRSGSSATFDTLDKTFNDVLINLGTGGASTSTVINITGSPTFRLLNIRSANTAAHTVIFDNNAQVKINKLVTLGASSSNKLKLQGNGNFSTGTGTMYIPANVTGFTTYGQFTNLVGFRPPLGYSNLYIGSNSTKDTASGNWLIQNPSQISTLVDALTSSPTSNSKWSIDYGTPTAVTGGKAGGGYSIPNARMTTTNTYDLLDSSISFENIAPYNGTLYFAVNLTSDISGPAARMYTADAGLSYGFTGEYKDMKGQLTKASKSTGSFKPSFVRMALDSTTRILSFDAYYDGVWQNVHNATVATEDLPYFRSARVTVYGGGSVGSVGYLPTPVASFNVAETSVFRSAPVQFNNTTLGDVSSWLWNFGDGTTSTLKNPTKTYTANGTYTVSLTATSTAGTTTEAKSNYITVTTKKYALSLVGSSNGGGVSDLFFEKASLDVTGSSTGGGQVFFFTVYRALAQKDYEYRVYDEDWNYIATWANEVTSQFGYSQRLNENASELPVKLARDPENRIVKYDFLMDSTGNVISDDRSDPIMLHTETPNAVGPGTDVRENLNVEVYAFYGGYEALLDHVSDPILDTNGEIILTQFGAPNGRRVYSGYISEYELAYGKNVGVDVTIVPQATELSHYVFKSGAITSVKYLNTDPVLMARNAMSNYKAQGGYIDYTPESMPLSGHSADYEFKLQTTRETVEKSTDLLPSGWYNYPHPGENLMYLREKSPTPNHVFYLGKHLTDLKLRRSISGLVNEVYFTGGEYDSVGSPGVDLLKYYKDQTSIDTYRRGLYRISDSRVELVTTAQILSEAQIEANKLPRYRTTVTITDVVYDIESIYLGDMIGFKNFGTFVDSLSLQVVAVQRSKHSIVLELDTILTNSAKRLDTLKRQIEQEQIRNIPSQPV